MSTFIATYPDVPSAQQALRSLLGDGISSDDISLVAHSEGNQTSMEAGTGRLADATYLVGRDDDPIDSPTPAGDEYRTSYLAESNIGGGIATSSPDDDVSQVAEMDDSQSAAEDMISPPEDRPYSRHEVDDLQETLKSGFPTTVPEIDGPAPLGPDHEADESVYTIAIPGFGLVIGGGALATVALDFAGSSQEGRNHFKSFLENEGVPGSEASSMLETLEAGGAVLSISIIPGETNPDAIEALAHQTGATTAALYDAPRF